MTYPLSPAATPDLAGSIMAVIPDAASIRIGTVTRYDAGSITIAISASDVLLDASYLFPAYQPVLGDNVAVVKQGNQWLALGALSANPEENVVVNHSFENGDYDVMAPDWTLYHDPASNEAAEVEVSRTAVEIDGPKMLRIGIDGVVVGAISSSIDYVSSAAFLVEPGQLWSVSAWITGSSLSGPPWVRGTAAVFLSFYASDAATYPNTAGADAGINTVNIPTMQTWTLVRSISGSRGIEIPEGVTHARVTLRTILTHEDTTANYGFSAYWDRVIARRLA